MTETPTQARGTSGAATRWLSVVVGCRRYDVVVDEHLRVSEVLALVQPDRELMALTLTGETVPLDETVAEARLETGTMLLAAPVGTVIPPPVVRLSEGGRLAGGRPAPLARPVATALAATLLAGVSLVAGFVAPPSQTAWPALGASLLVLAGVALARVTSASRLARLCAPLLGMTGGAATLAALGDGAVKPVVGGCAGVVLVARAGRSGTGPDRRVPRVWLAFAGGIGVLALVVLVLDMPLPLLSAVALAGSVLLARVVPDLVVHVADDDLLDVDRLSVTSSSPREARRPRPGSWRIDDPTAATVVATASLQQAAMLVGVAAVSVGSSAALWVTARDTTIGVRLLLAVVAVGLALTARAYRLRRDRTLLHLAALAPGLALVVPLAGRLGEFGASVSAATAVVLALAVAALAVALGDGYRSLWASRFADAAEAMALLSVVPLAVWAAGLVEAAMSMSA